MFHFHKWSKWSLQEQDWTTYFKRTGKNINYVRTFQVRECEKCGKIVQKGL